MPSEDEPLIDPDATEIADLMRRSNSGTWAIRRTNNAQFFDFKNPMQNVTDADLEEGMEDDSVYGGIVDNTIWTNEPSMSETESIADFYRNSGNQKQLHIVAFVNSRSGGQIGQKILKTLNNIFIPPESNVSSGFTGEVCDLGQTKPEETVNKLADLLDIKDVRLLVCGGDGTVTWILTVLDNCTALDDKQDQLPVAVMPLGTGNDLARSLGWGGKLSTVAGIPKYIKMVMQAEPVKLDQWAVILRPHKALPDDHKLHTPGSHPRRVENADLAAQCLEYIEAALPPVADRPKEVYIGHFQNYFSVGIDANIAQSVEYSRTKTCCGKCCFRRGCGKVCYVVQALLNAFFSRLLSRTIEPLRVKQPNSEEDDLESPWPAMRRRAGCCSCMNNVRQLMMVNINKYAAGQKVQPNPGSVKIAPSPNDKIIEILQVPNALRSFGIFLGMKPQYLTSAEAVAFTMWTGQHLQIDGEAWDFKHGCDVLVQPHREVMMLRVSDDTPPGCCQKPENEFWGQSEQN